MQFVNRQHLTINKRAFLSKLLKSLGYKGFSSNYFQLPPPFPCLCWQLTWLRSIQKHCDRWVHFSAWVSTGLCRKRITGNQTLNLEEEWCVPKIPISIVVLMGWGQGRAVQLLRGVGVPHSLVWKSIQKHRCADSPRGFQVPLCTNTLSTAPLGKESQSGQTRGSL